MWDTFEVILFDLDKLVFVAYFLLFLISVISERKVSSLVISLMVLSLANGTMTAITPILYKIASQSGLFYKFLWYGSFVMFDFIAIFLVYKFHRLLRQSVGNVASLVSLAFLSLGAIQTLRFFDRYILDVEILGGGYLYSIALINVAIVPAIIIIWALELKTKRQSYGVAA